MELEKILTLIDKVSQSKLTSFQLEGEGFRLSMERGQVQAVTAGTLEAAEAVRDDVSAASAIEGEGGESASCKGKIVRSPLVGTFYAAPAQDGDPFVQVGDQVKKGQVLAIVEAMKLMNDIESDFDGEIAEIYVENGQPVEYGMPLFRIA
ncbi:MAG: acetyl-CoA carboxylase biotin carboxyl carrier protein [Eubacteriales bacterium]|nr:acetyl-CoA carboxylase biotin carboxyl carrier protein [Eubacteriales bacterium]